MPDREKVLNEHKKKDAWESCSKIAEHPQILELFYETLCQMNFVGERRASCLVFLALCSRILYRPVSVIIKGPSSAGKSYIVKMVCKFFPPSAYHVITAWSSRVLAYTQENFEHRMIVINEIPGSGGEMGAYLLRSLLSEGYIAYETVEKTFDGFKHKRIEKAGPTGVIMTTTVQKIHPENETRLLSITVDDSVDHTREVLYVIAETPKQVDMQPWHMFQQWLELSKRPV